MLYAQLIVRLIEFSNNILTHLVFYKPSLTEFHFSHQPYPLFTLASNSVFQMAENSRGD
uniref:Uncharacterized protein n=1 Tax=Rhizophora mucronata TaxID=61149 RepID=A0A2P2PNL5_RHIMU